jgi:Ca-activated chloride channel family protein
MTFHPDAIWMLLLGLLIPVALWAGVRGRNRSTITFSSVEGARIAGRSLRSRLRWLPLGIRVLALSLLVTALARPVKANEQTRVMVEGVAMQMLVDRSSSMLAEDFQMNGQRANRLEAVKQVGAEFIVGGDGLPGRPNDLIGLIAFAGYADSLSPMTLDHAHLLNAMGGLKEVEVRSEDGTAIGDAVALAVERLRDVGERAEQTDRQRIKSRVIVLLTDGENTAGAIEPLMAADLAEKYGIKIYTIGMGTRGVAMVPVQTPFGREMRPTQVNIDEETLTEMADRTGGRYFRATDTNSLKEIYETIDELEKTETEQRRYLQYIDYAVEPLPLGGFMLPPLLLAAFGLLVLEQLLALTTFRSLP